MKKKHIRKTWLLPTVAAVFGAILTWATYIPEKQFIPTSLYVALLVFGVTGITWPLYIRNSGK